MNFIYLFDWLTGVMFARDFGPINNRSAKKSVSYHDLYNLSTADLLFDEKKKKRRPASKSLRFFETER